MLDGGGVLGDGAGLAGAGVLDGGAWVYCGEVRFGGGNSPMAFGCCWQLVKAMKVTSRKNAVISRNAILGLV